MIPEGVTSIPGRFLYSEQGSADYCPIKKITFPEGLVSIGEYAFQNCRDLVEIDLPSSLDAIRQFAFWNTSLREVVFPENLTAIDGFAFQSGIQFGIGVLQWIEFKSDAPHLNAAAIFYQPQMIVCHGYRPVGPGTERLIGEKTRVFYPREFEDDYEDWVAPENFGGYVPSVNDPVFVHFDPFDEAVAPPKDYEFTEFAQIGALPSCVRQGYEFVGWFTTPTGGEQIDATYHVLSNVTYYAHWTRDATVYTLRLYANNGTGETTDRYFAYGQTIFLLGVSFSNNGQNLAGWALSPSSAANGVVTYLPGGIFTGTNLTTMVGTVLPLYAVWSSGNQSGGGSGWNGGGSDGVSAGQPWTAQKAVVLDGAVYDAAGKVAGIIQLKVAKPNAKKRNAKISGSVTLLDGKKRTLKAAAFNVPADRPISANLSVKGLGTLSLDIGANGFEGSVAGYTVVGAKVGGGWTRADAKVYVDVTGVPAGTLEELLPDGEPVRVRGGKWVFDKAASIKYAKGVLSGFNDSGKPNLSAMKLTYTPKTGLFKGSFKLYALQGGKLKKLTVKITGVVVDGEGAGVAKLANPASTWSVSVR